MKKFLSILFIIALLVCFVGCENTNDVSSDLTSSPTESENISSDVVDSSKTESTTLENDDVASSAPSQTSSVVQSEISSAPTEIQTPVPELTAREKMTGMWRFVLPENKHTSDVFAFMGNRLVYDITIFDDNTVLLSEKHYKRSDFDTIGAVEYFEGNRYTLVYSSEDIKPDSFKGGITISSENENIAILNLSGYETATGQQLINEKHYLTLTDDGHLIWSKAELLSEEFDKQYFPWDKDTVFIKK